MPRRPVFALAFLSALTGCVGSPPKGPLVEYHAGLTPITRPVPCEADYVLRATHSPGSEPLMVRHSGVGERLGFRREEDGSVSAVAPGVTIPLPPGAYSWEVVRESVLPWKDRVRASVREDARSTKESVRSTIECLPATLGIIGLIVLFLGLSIAYGIGQGNVNSARR